MAVARENGRLVLRRVPLVVVVALAAAIPASAHGPGHAMSGGKAGDPAKVTRTIEVVATDNAFSLKSLQTRDGETIRFVVRNEGFDPHEFLIGTAHEHAEHIEMMRAMIEAEKKGQHAHAATMADEHASGVTVEPGKTQSFVWTFARTANLEFACDIPGHYKDGMHGPIAFDR
jgi:uncharacterized cupredoxin-like copper-binding protein